MNNVTFVRPYYHYVHRPGSITRSFRKDLFPNSAAYVMAADQILRASSLSKEKIMVYTKLVQTTSWYRDALSGISTGHSIAEVLNFMESCEDRYVSFLGGYDIDKAIPILEKIL